MKCCFIGHRNAVKTEELRVSLRETIISLISKGVDIFLFGSKSAFDELSWEVVTELKETYTYIKRIYVRVIYQTVDKDYEKYLLKFYEEAYFPKKIENAGKYSYVERNYEMIDNSEYCVFYYNEDYIVPVSRLSKSDMMLPRKRNSGVRVVYKYATKKTKKIINLYKS